LIHQERISSVAYRENAAFPPTFLIDWLDVYLRTADISFDEDERFLA
jgi:hypothetical protein